MARSSLLLLAAAAVLLLCQFPHLANARLSQNYYANICPNVETIVWDAVTAKVKQTPVSIPATLRLFFHDCMVEGCDASVMIASTPNNKAEKDHPINLSLAGDGFDTVIKAKAAVDAVPECRNKVSCADILAIATRDVIKMAGGPWYDVELGRLDGLRSTAASVNGRLPGPDSNVDQLTSLLAANGLSQFDMVALSGAHTVGLVHCKLFANRLYDRVDPTMNPNLAAQLKKLCPKNVDPNIAVALDPSTPFKFDNQYFKNLQQGMGLLTSDQVLYTDDRSRRIVNALAQNATSFDKYFTYAMTKLGRVGVKTGSNGNIRRDCAVFN
ncbi:peroxidase 51 [Canna indica]|uniref:Peroxidase n=1 Tax=Canna indica TaxID=4628 RepID=A0AAQ3K403_9LILI|nr:peroxidase 51 [Canna indica]